MANPVEKFDPVSNLVIGAAIEVHRILGPGFRESVYHKALGRELELRNIKFVREPSIKVDYKAVNVGTHEPDFVVEDEVVVELKVVEKITDVHVVQLISSMKATGKNVGLILNFAKKTLKEGIRRVVL